MTLAITSRPTRATRVNAKKTKLMRPSNRVLTNASATIEAKYITVTRATAIFKIRMTRPAVMVS